MLTSKVFQNLTNMQQAAARIIEAAAREAIAGKGAFSFVLSGGSTPHGLYQLLSQSDAMDWNRTQVFWGDERCLPPDHRDSNFNMAREALLSKVAIPGDNVHRIHGELPPTDAAALYENEIRAFFADLRVKSRSMKSTEGSPSLHIPSLDIPSFDMLLLGMGEDGHTASLFPGSTSLDELEHWVIAVEHDQPPPPLVRRITITLPLINAAANILFLVAGEGKAERVKQVLVGMADPPLPAQLVQPASGRLTWLLDRSAALKLDEQDS